MIGANQALKVLTPTVGDRDAEGVPVTTYEVTDAVVGNLHQKNAQEYVNGTWQTVEQWQAFLPAATVVDHKCVIQDDAGTNYRVESVAVRRGPTGAIHHISCTLTKAGA